MRRTPGWGRRRWGRAAMAATAFAAGAVVAVAAVVAPAPPAQAASATPWQGVPSANADSVSSYNGAPLHGVNDKLQSVSCAGGRCAAVGYGETTVNGYLTSTAVAEASTGGEWTVTPPTNPAGEYGDALTGVSCAGPTTCLAVGEQDNGIFLGDAGAPLAEKWDGTNWATMPVPAVGSSSYLQGVSCPTTTMCMAVGNTAFSAGPSGSNGALVERLAPATGAFVNPAAGTTVPPGQPTASPDGAYTATWNNATSPGTVTVSKGGQQVLTTQATVGGFSPDSHSFVTETLSGGTVDVSLYNLTSSAPGTSIFTAAPTATSALLAFSPSGRYLLFGYTTATQTFLVVTDATALSAAEANTFDSGGFTLSSPPGSGSASFGSAIYGFGPDDSRFYYAYDDAGAQSVEWRWTNLAQNSPQPIRSDTTSSTSGYAQFSPGGGALAIVQGSGTGSVKVDVFDSSSGQALGAGGPWNMGSPPALSSTDTEYVAEVGGQFMPLGPNGDIAWTALAAATAPVPAPPTSSYTIGAFQGEGLNAVSCLSASDCVAVGQFSYQGYENGTPYLLIGPLVEHWDGSAWNAVYSTLKTTIVRFDGVSCTADASAVTGDACVAVGEQMGSAGILQLSAAGDWTTWRRATGPSVVSGKDYTLSAAACLTPSDCTAAGEYTTKQGNSPMILHYDGTQWAMQPTPDPSEGSAQFLAGVACTGPATCTAVGGGLGGSETPAGFGTGPATLILAEGQGWQTGITATPAQVQFGTTVTYAATLAGPAEPTGTVAFFAGSQFLCSASIGTGGTSCRSAAAPPGNDPIFGYLVYGTGAGADQALSGGWSTASPLAVAPPPSTTTAGAAPDPALVGTTVTYSATVSGVGGPPNGGQVAFRVGTTKLCQASVSNGQASCTSAAAPIGTDTVTAAYGGTWNFAPSSGTTTVTVNPTPGAASTSTAVTPGPAVATSGDPVTFSVSVTSSSGSPTGTVALAAGPTPLCTATLTAGSGSCLSLDAPVGSDTVTATYSGAAGFASSSGTAPLTVEPASSTVRLYATNSTANTVTSYPGTFSGDAAPSATISDDGSGSALDSPMGAALDGSGDLWVANCAADTVSEYSPAELAASANPAPAALMTDDGTGALACPDALAFDPAGDLWVANRDANTVVSYSPSQLAGLPAAPGPSPAVTVADHVDPTNGDSLGSPDGLAFDPAGNLWVSSPAAATVVEFTPGQLAAAGAPSPSATVITGGSSPAGLAFDGSGGLWVADSSASTLSRLSPAQLTAGGYQRPAVVLTSDGAGTLSSPYQIAFDPRGVLWVANSGSGSLAEYTPDQLSSSGAPTPADVIAGPDTGLDAPAGIAVGSGALTTTKVAATPGAVTDGDTVKYSATVTSTVGTPSGVVTFSVGAVPLCAATLTGGSGSCTSTAAPIGTDAVAGVYSGDQASVGSAGGTTLTVAPPGPTVTVSASPDPATAGQNVEFSATVAGPGGTPTGTVSFSSGGVALCSAGLTGGAGSCVAHAPPAGPATITAHYAGDAAFAPANGSAPLTVGPAASGPAGVLVVNAGQGSITSYGWGAKGDALPAVTVLDDGAGSLGYPQQAALDGSGDLWVADCGSATVVSYAPSQLAVSGSPSPRATIADDGSGTLSCPTGVAFDHAGDLWVSNQSGGTLAEYTAAQVAALTSAPAGTATPTPAVVISDPGAGSSVLSGPAGLAFDPAGDLWVAATSSGDLLEYNPSQLAATGAPAPAAVLSDSGNGALSEPAALTFDPGGNLWVAATGSNSLLEYNPSQLAATGAPAPAAVLSDSGNGALSEPAALTFDPAGNLWVAATGSNSLLEYNPSQLAATGAPAPAATVGGPTSGLSQPTGIAVAGTPSAPPPAVPPAPTGVSATGAAGSVTLRWSAPVSAGGPAVSGYNVYGGTSPGAEGATPLNGNTPVTGTTFTAAGLTNGTTYYFTVTALGGGGESPASAEVSATPAAPSPPVTPVPPGTPTPPPPPGTSTGDTSLLSESFLVGSSPVNLSATSAGATGQVTVPAGALPAGTTVALYSVDPTAIGPTTGPSFVVGFAVSWLAPDGTAPTALAPITLTVSDPTIHAGDAVYVVGANGALTRAGTATTDGQVTVTFTEDPAFLISNPPVTREAGADRIGTAVAASRSEFTPDGSATAAVLARSDDFADALTGTPLATAKGGPLLLTAPSGLDPAAASELSRVLAPHAPVYLLGGTAALSSAVESAVASTGHPVVRVSGPDRYATAVAVADALGDPGDVLLASGAAFPDAATAGAAAGHVGGAVLLTDDSAPAPATSAYLSAHHPNTVYAVGGAASTAYPSALPLVGADRYDTAARVATALFTSPGGVALASGTVFADALSGGVQAAMLGWPMLLTDPAALPGPVSTYVTGTPSVRSGVVFGGTSAVNDAVREELNGLTH